MCLSRVWRIESPRRGPWLVPCVFLAGSWAYVWMVVRPGMIHDAFGIYLPYPEFSLDRTCWREAWSRAGGPVEHAGAFLSQWFALPPVGALIVVAAAALVSLGTNRLMRDMGATRAGLPSLIPVLAALIIYRTYHHPLDALLALAACLGAAVAYQRMAAAARAAGLARIGRPTLFLVLCFGLYCLAGSVCVLFGLLVGTWDAMARRRVVAGAGAAVASALAPGLIGATFYSMTIVEAYGVLWPFGPGSRSDMETLPLLALRGLFLFPLGALWALALGRAAPRALRDGFVGFRQRGGWTLQVAAELGLLAAAVAVVHHAARTPHREHRFEMVHFARARQWDEVLRAARRFPASGHDCFSRHLADRALYHTGRLGDDLFSFSQEPAGLLLLGGNVPHTPPKFWMLSEIAWELGDLNLAEQWAFERLEAVGECPSALELLAMVCLAKGRPLGKPDPSKATGPPREAAVTAPAGHLMEVSAFPGREAARILLHRMAKNVIQGRRAKTLLESLDAAVLGGDGRQLDRVRALRCTEDRVFQAYSEELMLEGLLRANPRNQMAFEYLMAFYLLDRRPDKIVQNLHRLGDFGYRQIPRHYEEAVLIHAQGVPQPTALGDRKIRAETIQRFQRFVERARPWLQQPHLAAAALAEEFGDSYFYYYLFGISGTGGSP